MHAQARPGRDGATLAFARVSFDYFISEAVFDYIVEAVHLVANEGWKLLPLYRFDPRTGLWHHATRAAPRAAQPRTTSRSATPRRPRPRPRARSRGQLDEARRIIRAAPRRRRRRPAAVTGVRAHPLVPAAGRGAR